MSDQFAPEEARRIGLRLDSALDKLLESINKLRVNWAFRALRQSVQPVPQPRDDGKLLDLFRAYERKQTEPEGEECLLKAIEALLPRYHHVGNAKGDKSVSVAYEHSRDLRYTENFGISMYPKTASRKVLSSVFSGASYDISGDTVD